MRFYFFIFSLVFIGCKNTPEQQFPVLEEKKVTVQANSLTERSNLLEQMWVEVRKQNDVARDIEIESKEWDKVLKDSLASWNHFLSRNQEYYGLLPLYLNKIQDSTQKTYWTSYFDSSKQEFFIAVDSVKFLAEKIQQQRIELNDVIVQMKMKLTHDMLKEYQKAQIPSATPLEKITIYQDSLLKYYRLLLSNDTIQTLQ